MFESFKKYAVACLLVLLIGTFCGGKGTLIITPVCFVIVAGLYIKPMMTIKATIDETNMILDSQTYDAWVNECLLDSDINFEVIRVANDTAQDLIGSMWALFIVLMLYSVIVATMIVLPCLCCTSTVIASKCCECLCGRQIGGCSSIPNEALWMIKMYKHFN